MTPLVPFPEFSVPRAVRDIGDFFVPEAYRVTYCRCDLHPRWRRDGRALAINSVHEGSRQISLVDAD